MALRLVLVLTFLLPLTLFSSTKDFKACQLKYQVSSVKIGKTQAFAISDKYALFYSKDEPSVRVVKRDHFLGLNLIETPKRFRHSFKFHSNLSAKHAGVSPYSITEGKLISSQIGINNLAKFSKPLKTNTLITDDACGIVGISTPEGVIEKEYIKYFLKSKEISYGDLGIRLIDKKGVCVDTRNPFFEKMSFIAGDIIVYMDGKKVKDASAISRKILMSKPKSMHNFVVLRDKKKIKIKAEIQKRLGGGLIEDNFLEIFGFLFDKNLVVTKDNAKYGVKKGDRLKRVMGKEVKISVDVDHVLSQEKPAKDNVTALLFQRNGFDFFIHLLKP